MSNLSYVDLDVDDPAHLHAAYEISRDCELTTVGWTDTTLEQVTANLSGPIAWREAQLLVRDGEKAVGLLAVENDVDKREVFLDGYALGERRREILDELLDRGLAAARSIAAADPREPGDDVDLFEMNPAFWQASAATYGSDQDYVDAILGHGFRSVRTYWRMYLDFSTMPVPTPAAPPGVSKRVVDGDSDRHTMLRLMNESFAEHYNDVPRTFDAWFEQLLNTEGCDPSRWWIAELDGVPAALCILDDSKAEFGEGYVRTLGVIKDARGRGIARWLLHCSAADAVERGRVGLALTVDGQNTTGATRLYESVGFRTRQQIDLYSCPLVDSAHSR